MGEHLELPRPLALIRTAGWNLAESVGLPVAAFALGAWLGGREIGLIAGLAIIWITLGIRRLATGSVTGLLMISSIVLTLQTVVALATGNLWIFLLHFPLANLCLCLLFARGARGPNPLCARLAAEMIALKQPLGCRDGLHCFFRRATLFWSGIFLALAACLGALLAIEPVSMFLLLSTVATVSLIVAGTGACALWFRSVLRRLGVGLRFAPAA